MAFFTIRLECSLERTALHIINTYMHAQKHMSVICVYVYICYITNVAARCRMFVNVT